jgi:hypothetical protein
MDSRIKGFPCLPHSKVSQSISVYMPSLQLTDTKREEPMGFAHFQTPLISWEATKEKINACICLFSHQLQCFWPQFTSAAEYMAPYFAQHS